MSRGRPKTIDSKPACFTLDKETVNLITKLSKERKITKSSLIRQIVKREEEEREV